MGAGMCREGESQRERKGSEGRPLLPLLSLLPAPSGYLCPSDPHEAEALRFTRPDPISAPPFSLQTASHSGEREGWCLWQVPERSMLGGWRDGWLAGGGRHGRNMSFLD